MASTPIRLTGFSGMLDTDSLIKKLMDAEKLPLNKINRNKQFTLWQREDYRSMNTTLLNFQNSVNKLRFEKNFEKTTASSSNSSVMEVTNSGSNPGVSSIQIDKVATSAMIVGGKVAGTSAESVNVGGSVEINGETISFTSGTSTIDSIIKDINSKSSKTGVRASFDQSSKVLYLSTTSTGAKGSIDITGTGLDDFKSIFNLGSTTAKGSDAEYIVNNTKVTSSSNNVSINGVQVTLKSIGNASVVSTTDRSGVVEDIKNFVEQYNSLIDTYTTASTAKKSRDYQPLTDEEKESMSESQIVQWEKKARSGTLYNDSILKDTLSSMRVALNKPLDVPKGEIQLLSDIGITVKADYRENGKLEIDEAKLEEAINTRFDEVKRLFVQTSDVTPAAGKSNLGMAERIYDISNKQIESFRKKIGSGSIEALDNSVLGKQLKTLSDQESAWKIKLQDIETRYYKRFTAMEQALQKMNSQSSWLGSQLG